MLTLQRLPLASDRKLEYTLLVRDSPMEIPESFLVKRSIYGNAQFAAR